MSGVQHMYKRAALANLEAYDGFLLSKGDSQMSAYANTVLLLELQPHAFVAGAAFFGIACKCA